MKFRDYVGVSGHVIKKDSPSQWLPKAITVEPDDGSDPVIVSGDVHTAKLYDYVEVTGRPYATHRGIQIQVTHIVVSLPRDRAFQSNWICQNLRGAQHYQVGLIAKRTTGDLWDAFATREVLWSRTDLSRYHTDMLFDSFFEQQGLDVPPGPRLSDSELVTHPDQGVLFE
jgi:hypothetical protein